MIKIFHSDQITNSEQAYKNWLHDNPSGEEVEAKAQAMTGLTSLKHCTKCFTKESA